MLQHPILLCPALSSSKRVGNIIHQNSTSISKVSENLLNRQTQQKEPTNILPWSNPSNTQLILFNPLKEGQITKKWERAIICNWINPPQDFEKTAIAIAKECHFHFIPTLLPFGDKRALFFCPSLNDAITASSKGPISSSTNTVYLHK